MTFRAALSLAGVAFPLYAGLLHAWLYAQRRREPVQLWLAAAALLLAGQALCGPAAEAGLPRARVLELGLGTGLVAVALPGVRGLLGRRRTRLERSLETLLGVGVALLAVAAAFPGSALGDAVVGAGPAPALGPLGVAFACAQAAILAGLAVGCARLRPAVPALCLAWLPWVAAAWWDAAGAFGLHPGAPLARWAALPMLTTGSLLLVRRFVRSMLEAERLAHNLNALVEERSATLRRKELQLAHGEPLASLGALAAGVARATHEPLGFLEANLTHLHHAWRQESRDRVPHRLADCRQAVEQLRAVVSQVLAVARRSEQEREPVDLREVVASVLPIVRPLGEGQTELVHELAPVASVPGDRRLLGQVALQLLLNAVQAGSGGPGRRNRVRVVTEQTDEHVRLHVEDSGPGIAPELLPRVFDPFFTPEEGERGPALGLAVVHQIVARHGGRVQLASDTHGTRVVVELPRPSPSAAGPAPELAPAR